MLSSAKREQWNGRENTSPENRKLFSPSGWSAATTTNLQFALIVAIVNS